MKKLIVMTAFIACLYASAHAQVTAGVEESTKCVMEKATAQEAYPCFEALKDAYFKDNRYADFVDLLNSVKAKKKNLAAYADYYIALSRYQQLKYLEQAQKWDDYFANGNTYRDELTASAKAALEGTLPRDAAHAGAALILWKFHKDQQDAFTDAAFADMSAAALAYARDPMDLSLVKKIAEELAAYGERAKSKEVYKLYVDKVMASAGSDDDLAKTAAAFFNEGNVDLSSTVYDKYIAALEAAKDADKNKTAQVLSEIAKKFSYKDNAACDPAYAEKIWKKMETLAGGGAFDQDLIYLRAFNLEKIKDYKGAYDVYAELVNRYPDTVHLDTAVYKMGVMQVYAFRNLDKGREYFQQLAQKETVSPQVIASLYQLGLLSQWAADTIKAKDYYNRLIERGAGNFQQTRSLADKRLSEIDGQKDIEYNLKTFLDASLKSDSPAFNPDKADVNAVKALSKTDEAVSVTATAYAGESGCSQVSLYYLWSGDLGDAAPASDQADFSPHYTSPGTDVVNLVVMSPNGILDRSFVFIDIN